jgi:predicted aspartyl protease
MSKDAGRGNEIYVTIRLASGEALPFVLDTGTSWTVFDKSLEPKLGPRVATGSVWRWGMKEEAGIYVAPRLYLRGAQLLMTGTQVATDDFKSISAEAGRPILGILGMDVLEHYCIQLDFETGKIHFLDSEHADKSKWGKAFPLTDIGDGCLATSENLAGMKGSGSIIDTGCNYDGWLTAEVFQQWTNQTHQLASGEVHRPDGALGGKVYHNLNLRGLTTESHSSSDAHIQRNGIGLHFLSRHFVTLDFPNRTMYLKPPSVWSQFF